MNKIMNFVEKSEVWIFYVFLLTFTLSIRKVLFFYPIRGKFNEYSGIYFYLSDLFVWGILGLAGISILCNKILLKSRYRIDMLPYLKQKTIIFPLLLVILSFFSVFWSENHNIAIFRSIKLLEFYLLYLWVIFRMFHLPCRQTGVKHKENEKCSIPEEMFHVEHSTGQAWNIFKNSIFIIVLMGIIQSIVAIWQFIIQKSIGLIWIKESIISVDISGVAKIVLGGEKYIRSYGLFPHPNILAGFLVFSIILTGLYFRMFNLPFWQAGVKHKSDEKCSTWNNYIYWIVLGIQGVALFLTFSKSGWIGLLIAILWIQRKRIKSYLVNRKMLKNLFHLPCQQKGVEQIEKFILIVGIIILLIVIFNPSWQSFLGKSIEDRMFYLNVSRETFLKYPILGIGSGQFVLNLESVKNIQDWQFQPVHSVFLLILNELGILGLVLFVLFFWEITRIIPIQNECFTCLVGRQAWNIIRGRRGTFQETGVEHLTGHNWNIKQDKIEMAAVYIKSIFLGFLFIMLFDHYFWDIQQGQMMLWLVLGIVAGINMCISYKSTGLSTEKE